MRHDPLPLAPVQADLSLGDIRAERLQRLVATMQLDVHDALVVVPEILVAFGCAADGDQIGAVNGRNPSAFAVHRNVGYNLAGVLNVSAEAVRDTLFHEIFHINDDRHEGWSTRALAATYERILARCGRRTACLAPYSPTDTLMDGIYYAFAPKGGVREYAAELGLRYFCEQRLLLAGEPLPGRPFKCGPPENAAAWSLPAAEFFGGVDLVPGC